MSDILDRLRDALNGQDETGSYTVVTRSLLTHLLSEAVAAIEQLQRDAQRDRWEAEAMIYEEASSSFRKTSIRD